MNLLNGYPIGSILLWEPSKEDIDPFRRNFIDFASETNVPRKIYYILDGQQRLTALMLLASGWRIKRGGKEISCSPLSYDPSKRDLELYKGGRRGIDLYRGLKDCFHHDIEERLRLQKDLGDGYVRFIRFVEKKLLDYEVPVYIVRTAMKAQTYSVRWQTYSLW